MFIEQENENHLEIFIAITSFDSEYFLVFVYSHGKQERKM
jgi:hypothetical protein